MVCVILDFVLLLLFAESGVGNWFIWSRLMPEFLIGDEVQCSERIK